MKTITIAIMLLALGCAPDETETRESAVSSIGSWQTLAGLSNPSLASPVFVRAPGQGWTVFKQAGSSGFTWITTETSPGSGMFNTTWSQLSGSDTIFAGPAVAVLSSYSPPRFLVVITGTDNQIRAQVQDQTGATVFAPWHAVWSGGQFLSPPSVAFAGHPAGGSTPELMLVARGTDDRMYYTKNVMVSGLYDPTQWGSRGRVSDTQYTSKPSVIEMCGYPNIIPLFPFIVAARLPSDGSYVWHKYDGPSAQWLPAIPVANGQFVTGPALACAATSTNLEVTIFGLGLGPFYRVWYKNLLSGGQFNEFTGDLFNQNVIPSVGVFGNQLRLGAVLGTSIVTNTANSP